MSCDKNIKVGINGFGRVGFQIIKNLLLRDNNNVELVAINDPSILIDDMAVLFNYFRPGLQQHVFEVKNENTLQFGQKFVSVHAVRNPEEIPWADTGVDLVVESTGLYTDLDKAAAHLKAGAKKVIITDISKDAPMYVFGVNEKEYKPEYDHIVSSASCITHQLAPILEVIHARFGILEGQMKILDLETATQDVDGPSMTDCGDGRPAFFSLIPKIASRANAAKKLLEALNDGFGIFESLMPTLHTTFTVIKAAEVCSVAAGELLGIDDLWTPLSKLLSTLATTNTIDGPREASSTDIIPADVEAVGKILAYLYGKLTGTVSHGPTIGGSIVNLTVSLELEATLEDIKAAIKEESEGKFKGILGYTEGDYSRDLLDDGRSSIFNATPRACSASNDNSFKFIFCCDNQWGYGCRVIDLIVHMASV